MESKDVSVLDGVGDRVGVKALLEEVFRRLHSGLGIFDLLLGGVLLEDRRSGEAEELRSREEILDGLVVFAELRAMAFVEDESDPLVAKRFQLLLEALLAVFL